MPNKNFKSVSVSMETYKVLQDLAKQWEQDLDVKMSPGKVIARLALLQTK